MNKHIQAIAFDDREISMPRQSMLFNLIKRDDTRSALVSSMPHNFHPCKTSTSTSLCSGKETQRVVPFQTPNYSATLEVNIISANNSHIYERYEIPEEHSFSKRPTDILNTTEEGGQTFCNDCS